MSGIIEIANISEVADKYEGFIVDLYGVASDGERFFSGVLDTLRFLKEKNKKLVFLSNSSKRVKDMAISLLCMGMDSKLYDGILTSGEIVYYDLKNKSEFFFKKLGRKYFFIGNPRHRLAFESAGHDCVEALNEANFIIIGGTANKDDIINNYLSLLQEALGLGLPMVCANPDRVDITADNIPVMGAGYIAWKYSKMGGNVFGRGKPRAETFMYCLEGMEIADISKVVVVGDAFETDIIGGHDAGFDTIFVSGGIHARELHISRGEKPNLNRVEELSRHFGVFPSYTIPTFK